MAKVVAAWGIDIGQCALKALRCSADQQEPGKVVADAFDYIEYPKILTQPEADPDELVREALLVFLSRNDVGGAHVAVSASGQSGLARFIKLPPVETKNIPDIVRYEANQQIPFALDDVIWDYQRMSGGSEEEGFALETEVGLFAMKRDQVYQEIELYREVGINIDIVQLTPLAIYNYVVFDQIGATLPEDEFDPEEPPESLVVLSVGTESTDLVITNGYRVWQRSVPLGGSHFTKALVKDLQLTYAKAEHLKRNATQAENPKAIYQAMRPILKDLLTEIQRSIGYFQSLDRSAQIGRIIALGNSMKLPGLKRYLSQNLGHDVEEVKKLQSLTGSTVIDSPAFKDNVLAFGVPYGLALQGLSLGYLSTNLVPREMVRGRMINRKKPWAIAASVLLTLGCMISFLILWWPWSQVRINDDEEWKSAKNASESVEQRAEQLAAAHANEETAYRSAIDFGEQRIALFDRRTHFLNLCQAVYQSLPTDADAKPGGGRQGADDAAAGILTFEPEEPPATTDRVELWITDMRARDVTDLKPWFDQNKDKYDANSQTVQLKLPDKPEADKPDASAELFGKQHAVVEERPDVIELPAPVPRFASSDPPTGPGYIVELTGYHFHNSLDHGPGDHFVRRTLVHNLQDRMVTLPNEKGRPEEVPINRLGISYPLVFESQGERKVLSPFKEDKGPKGPKEITQYRFVVQFAWQPTPPGDPEPSQIEPTQIARAGEE